MPVSAARGAKGAISASSQYPLLLANFCGGRCIAGAAPQGHGRKDSGASTGVAAHARVRQGAACVTSRTLSCLPAALETHRQLHNYSNDHS